MIYRKLSLVIFIICGLLLLCSGLWLLNALRSPGGSFDDEDARIREALRLPWTGFLPVTESEKKIIRDLDLDEPVFMNNIRYWDDIPKSGMFSYPRTTKTRDRMEKAHEIMGRIQNDKTLNRAQIGDLFKDAVGLLNRADKSAPNRWLTQYNLGVLYLWMDQKVAARRFLKKADKLIAKQVQLPPDDPVDRHRIFEAGIVTRYALAHAVFPEPNSGEDGLIHFREAVKRLATIAYDEQNTDYYAGVVSGYSFFNLRYTGLDTQALWNDLIAAYMKTPEFHQKCEDGALIKPTQAPDCAARRDGDDDDWKTRCHYRDAIFCGSLGNAEEPYRASYERLFRAFYEQGRWEDEHLLWALSNLVDINVYNPGMYSSPAILYNSSLLHLKVGDFKLAASQISDAYHSPDFLNVETGHVSRIRGDYGSAGDQINKLRIVVNVLVGNKLKASSCPPSKQPSLLRVTFQELYPDQRETPSFPAVGACFEEPEQERQVDKWLFIHIWRKLLEDGNYPAFDEEYSRLLKKKDVFTGFFEQWRGEVFSLIGDRALEERASCLKNGEYQKADLIEAFLMRSGFFKKATLDNLKMTPLDYFRRWRRVLAAGFAFAFCLFLTLAWQGRHRALTGTFVSFHRVSRKKEPKL